MINKEKISRVLVYDITGRLLVITKSVHFPKDFFKIKNNDLVMLKGSDFPLISKNESIDVIFEYINGTRIKYRTAVDLCTEYQINFHVGEGINLEERRRSYKIDVNFNGVSPFYIRGEEMYTFEKPAELQFKNINLGGVFFTSSEEFEKSDQIMLNFLNDEMEILSEVLRVQCDENGNPAGYGCRFLNINQSQEEKLARFIFDCQLIERERRRKAQGIV